MDPNEIELMVGDSIWIGEHRLTVVEIDDEGVHIRLDDATFSDGADTTSGTWPLPK